MHSCRIHCLFDHEGTKTRRIAVCLGAVGVIGAAGLAAQQAVPPLPDSSGWGVHVLVVRRDPHGSLWVGTYGQGIFRLRPGAQAWEHIRSDTTAGSISWDFVHAFGFGPSGQIWYGTVGNGWGVSLDDGRTWKNWTYNELGPEWQYVTPNGIVTRGDTTVVATADGLQITTDDGAHWLAIGDSVGPAARGPADTALPLLQDEYVLGMYSREEINVQTLTGLQEFVASKGRWQAKITAIFQGFREMPRTFYAADDDESANEGLVPSNCGLARKAHAGPCLHGGTRRGVTPPAAPKTTWFRRPIDRDANSMIDQTYRYGSTMGGNFQQHQGVEFNNPDGTPVHAIGAGVVVYAGRAEAGALTVAIRHDTTITTAQGPLYVFSTYYHNSALLVQVGDRVRSGQVISRVGNTGRATNDHLHLEVHAAPTDSVAAIVDSLNRYPSYTTNPELWIAPLPGTGIVAGRVLGEDGRPVLQARIYGLIKAEPRETPFSYVETYGTRTHPHLLYGENFAIGDVPPGDYVLGTEIDGQRVLRRVKVAAGRVTWVEFTTH